MNKIKQVNLQEYFKLPNPGLRAYFSHTLVGNAEDYRPPFWSGLTRAQVIEKWLDVVNANKLGMIVPGLDAYEMEMMTKIGPLSIQEPLIKRIPSIEDYYEMVKKPSVPIPVEAMVRYCDTTLKSVRGITIRGQRSVVLNMRLSTNSGNPYFTRRRNVLDDTVPCGIMYGKMRLHYDDVWPYAAILGWRGQEGGAEKEDVKQRVVFMFPFAVNVAELQAYQPLISAWQARNINSAYISQRAVEMKITKCFDTKGDNYVVGTDFSKFDQHFNSHLQEAAHHCLHYMFANPKKGTKGLHTLEQHWLDEVFPIKYNIPLICGEDLMYTGPHGMGSGSGGTNFDECLAHGCMQHEAAMAAGKELNPFSNAYGDDGYLSFEGIDVDKVISIYQSHGQDMNPDKQYVDKHSAIYLRRYYHDSYRDGEGIMLGIYPTFRALGRLLGQERYYSPEVWSKEMVVLRALAIIENCASHPLFTKFVDFVAGGDKYKLGLLIPGFFRELPKLARKAMDLMPDFLGYTKSLQDRNPASGIMNWTVVRYLMSK